jgi:DHA1 family bicyclomycin/chloramphenicol resistance-like MFS transporter
VVTSAPVDRAGDPSDRSTTRRPLLVLILGALGGFGPLSIDMYLPGLPALSRELGASASEAQLTLSACLLGLALGQTVSGPLSDALGRRRPLLAGLAAYVVASLLCAAAPSVYALVALRFVQGVAGAAGLVIGRAIVRDLHHGLALARFFSILMLVSGLAPILAPIFGAQLMRVTSWRGVFLVLALLGLLLLMTAGAALRETLPPERRQTGGFAATIATFRRLLTDRAFVGYALSGGLAIGAMFAYIAGSPFVLQNVYGASPQLFSLIFGSNALGIMAVGQINARLVGRLSPVRLLATGLAIGAAGGLALLASVSTGVGGLPSVLASLFLVVASLGLVLPNASALALAGDPRIAGSASALLGLLQFVVGAAAAPLVGLGGEATAWPMAALIATLGLSGLSIFWLLVQPEEAVRGHV